MPVETDTELAPDIAGGVVLGPRVELGDTRRPSLCEVLDRVLNKGAVIDGELTISVAGIDLVYLGLKLVLTSIETARRNSLGGTSALGLALLKDGREEQTPHVDCADAIAGP